jgi:hypothetical protein
MPKEAPMDVIVDRCAGLDVHKKTVMATIRTPDGAGGRAQQTREFATFTGRLVELGDWPVLIEQRRREPGAAERRTAGDRRHQVQQGLGGDLGVEHLAGQMLIDQHVSRHEIQPGSGDDDVQ